MVQVPQRVVWTEGMLMSPQHLQQQDLYHDAHLEARLAAIGMRQCGLLRLSFDEAALSLGEVALASLSAVMPSGLWVERCSAAGEPPLRRTLGDAFAAEQAHLDVYLCVARMREGIANVADGTAPQAQQRFVMHRRQVAELCVGATPAQSVAYFRPHLQLLWANELHADVESFKIAQIDRAADGSLRLSETFVPPLLEVGGSPYLMQNFRSLFEGLWASERILSSLCAGGDATRQPQMLEVRRLHRLAGIRSALVLLQELIHAPETPTRQAYRILCRVLGAAMDPQVEAARWLGELLPWRTDDLYGLFSKAFELAQLCLRQETGGARIYPFVEQQDGSLRCELKDVPKAPFGSGIRWLVRLHAPSPLPPSLVSSWPKMAKLAAHSQLEDLQRAAAAGIGLAPDVRHCRALAWQPHAAYFSVEDDHPSWRQAMQESAVGLLFPANLVGGDALKVDLIALQGAAPSAGAAG